jgi:hypothetical protein
VTMSGNVQESQVSAEITEGEEVTVEVVVP